MSFVNVYPARVAIDGKWYPQARVRSNRDVSRIQVWVRDDNAPRKVVCILDAPVVAIEKAYNQFDPLRNRRAKFLTGTNEGDQQVLEVQAMPGCGCGNPLKALPSMTPESQAGVGV